MDPEQAQAQVKAFQETARANTRSPVGDPRPQSNHAPDPDEDDLDDLDGASRIGVADDRNADRRDRSAGRVFEYSARSSEPCAETTSVWLE